MTPASTQTTAAERGPAGRADTGFSLIELMVALTISLLLLAGVCQIFLTSRATYTLDDNLARTQEAGRFAMAFLTQDIRMAGYAGCNSHLPASSIDNIATPSTTAYQFRPGGLRGYHYVGTGSNNLSDWSPSLPGDFFTDGQVHAGTDVLVVQRGSVLDAGLTGNMSNAGANLQILDTTAIAGQIASGDVLLVSDCRNIDVFRTDGVSTGSGKITLAHGSDNSSSNLFKAYTTQAQLMKFVSRAYYIGTGQSGEPALMRTELASGGALSGPPLELVEGIEDMRLTYGEDTATPPDGAPNLYRTADAVGSWDKVVSMHVGLLARTPGNVEGQPETKTYSFDGVTLDPPNDHRRRQFFLSTVEVRN